MTPQQVIGIGTRLFSIWLALSSVAFFSAIPSALSATAIGSGDSVAVSYAVGVLYVLVAVFLWIFPMAVAHKLLPRTHQTDRLTLPGFELARTGVGLLGLWLAAKPLPTLVWMLFRAFLFVNTESAFSALDPNMKLEVGVAAFEVVLGIVFVVKSTALARVITSNELTEMASHDDL